MENENKAILANLPKQTNTPSRARSVAGTHPAAQAAAPFAGDLPLAGLRKQPCSAARAGAQHAPHLQHALFGAILLVPVVLQRENEFFKVIIQTPRCAVLPKC